MKKGFTLIEVLICSAVTGLVSGVIFVATEGVRENGRQAVCAQNLKQIYQALELYSDANPGPEQIPGIGNIKLLPKADAIAPYLKSQDVLFCPDTPRFPKAKAQYWSTYELNFVNVSANKNKKLQSFVNTFKAELDSLGPKMPLAICNMHDETYYGPREQDIDSDLAQPFQIQLQLDGSVAAHRFVAKRHRSFTAFLGGS